jgi:hypothetical protein
MVALPGLLMSALGCKTYVLHPLRQSAFWTSSKIYQLVYGFVKTLAWSGEWKSGYAIITGIIHKHVSFLMKWEIF